MAPTENLDFIQGLFRKWI